VPIFKYRVKFPLEVIYEIEADTEEKALYEANQLWFENGWYRTHPECPLELVTEETPAPGYEVKELLQELDELEQASLPMAPKERYSVKRLEELQELRKKTKRLTALLEELLMVVYGRGKTLDKEIEVIVAVQPE
jgi:hypothetical protein